MKIAIRVDASRQIGTGHFMRCLTLAEELRQRGSQTCFVSRDLPTYLQEMLATNGNQLMSLNSSSGDGVVSDLAHAHWLEISQDTDAQDCFQVLSGQVWDWLIVDHYALDARWESVLRPVVKNILVIDDIADRQHDCDVLLDQNFYADMATRYTGKVPAHCRLLLGPRYALLRNEFLLLREQVKPRSGPVKRVLVFFGGVDADNYTGRTIEALSGLGIQGGHVDVVIGAEHPHREQIQSSCVAHQYDCHVQTSRMAELMAAADLAIGAGGVATWERCCLAVPTFTICTADNQVRQVVDAASECLLYAPEVKEGLSQAIKLHLPALWENSCLRRVISRKAMEAVDGRGVLRVIGNLVSGGIKVRVANQADSEQLFEWRNHHTVRAVSRNPDLINWEDHQEWFAAVMNDPDRVLLVGQREDVSVGVVRFDIQDDEAEVSIYLVPGIKGSGLGRGLLQSAEHWFAANRPEIRKIFAHVLGTNEQSHRLFLGADYQVQATSYSKRLF